MPELTLLQKLIQAIRTLQGGTVHLRALVNNSTQDEIDYYWLERDETDEEELAFLDTGMSSAGVTVPIYVPRGVDEFDVSKIVE